MPTLAEYKARGVDVTTMTSEQLEAEGYITPMNELPIVVDGPGKYLTRDGRTVTIIEVTPTLTRATTAFTAKGYLHLGRKWMTDPYDAWHISGRIYSTANLSGKDIVSKLL